MKRSIIQISVLILLLYLTSCSGTRTIDHPSIHRVAAEDGSLKDAYLQDDETGIQYSFLPYAHLNGESYFLSSVSAQ